MDTWDLAVLVLIIACESTMISVKMSIKIGLPVLKLDDFQ